jgi:DNA-binding PadR family transcriptional regulator
MRNWTNLGYNFSLSTMYRHLAVLENEGFVEFYNVEHDNRERKVYRISAKGMQILKDRTLTILSNYNGKNDEDFYVAFSMLPLLSRREQVAAISQSLNRIKNHKKKLEGKLEENFHLPLNVTGLFIHPIKILATDIEFLEEVLRTIKEEKEKVDLKS